MKYYVLFSTALLLFWSIHIFKRLKIDFLVSHKKLEKKPLGALKVFDKFQFSSHLKIIIYFKSASRNFSIQKNHSPFCNFLFSQKFSGGNGNEGIPDLGYGLLFRGYGKLKVG